MSLVVVGIAGLALNVLILVVYGTETLGVFNQVFTVYVVSSQLAVGGIQFSVFQRCASTTSHQERSYSSVAALLLTLIVATVVCVTLWIVPFSRIFNSPMVGEGVHYIIVGVFFFALSKVAIGTVNAQAKMRWYAALQASRFVFFLVCFLGHWSMGLERATLPLIISVAECGVFLLTVVAIRDVFIRIPLHILSRRIVDHFIFGLKSSISGVLGELSTRIDILMLGIFLNDKAVGIYSFAALIVEGFAQLLTVVRVNIAPRCTELLAMMDRSGAESFMRLIVGKVYIVSLPVILTMVMGYCFVLPRVFDYEVIAKSGWVFAFLMLGIAGVAGYVPLSQALLYLRKPGLHSAIVFAGVVLNIILNAVLIDMFGMEGAAIATSVSLVVTLMIIRAAVRRVDKIVI